MVDYEVAKKLALESIKDINACREYEKAYHFYNKDNDVDGGYGIVIIKENGNKLSWIRFILDYHPENTPKELKYK